MNIQAKVVLEFGLQTIHKNEMKMINRMNNLKRVEEVVVNCRNSNVTYEISIIYGLPNQTLDSFRKTVDYCKEKLDPDILHAFPLMLLRGTELFDKKDILQLTEGLK